MSASNNKISWTGVMPAITTSFHPDLTIDFEFVAGHCRWLIENGCTAIVTPGSLGEGATMTDEEKCELWETCVDAVGETVPVVAAISALSTANAIGLAKSAEQSGCKGLMVLPPYVYKGDWMEMKTHVQAVMDATPLSCMLYNNPVAYGTDFLPEQIAELAEECANLHAVKESSTDVCRITAIKAILGDRVAISVGVDDLAVEGVAAGATGWVAGLVNAMPKESVELFNFALAGKHEEAAELYAWFLPLLRMDTVPKFVQLIKLVQEEMGVGNSRVRMPRMKLTGQELNDAKSVIQRAVKGKKYDLPFAAK